MKLCVPSCLLPVNSIMMLMMRSLVSNECYRSPTEVSNIHKFPTRRWDDYNHFQFGPGFARGKRLRRSTFFVELEPLSQPLCHTTGSMNLGCQGGEAHKITIDCHAFLYPVLGKFPATLS